MEFEIVACVLILVILVFLATVDLAFAYLSDLSLRRISADTDDAGKARTYAFLREILDNRPLFRFALSSAIQLLLITFTVLVTILVMRYTLDRTYILLYALGFGLLATLVLRQFLPRLIVRNDPERVLLTVLPVVRPVYGLASVAVRPFERLFPSKEQLRMESSGTPGSAEDRLDDDEEMQAFLEVGEAEGIIEEDEREMIEAMVFSTITNATSAIG
jgi:putative hemolysin